MFGFINDRDARLILLLFIYFGEAEGKTAYRFVLKNQSGMDATITNYGGIIISVNVPDRTGKFEDVVLVFDFVQSIKITSGVMILLQNAPVMAEPYVC
jgi:galactose mutarotase-like enzyme